LPAGALEQAVPLVFNQLSFDGDIPPYLGLSDWIACESAGSSWQGSTDNLPKSIPAVRVCKASR
jgi:hypothetical protein